MGEGFLECCDDLGAVFGVYGLFPGAWISWERRIGVAEDGSNTFVPPDLVGFPVEFPDGITGGPGDELQALFTLSEFLLHFAAPGDVDERGEAAGLAFDPEGGGIDEDLFKGAGSGLERVFCAGGFGSAGGMGLIGPEAQLVCGAADDLVAGVLGKFLEGVVDLEEAFIFFCGDSERGGVVVEGSGEGSEFAVAIRLEEEAEAFLVFAEFLTGGSEGKLQLVEGLEVYLLASTVVQGYEGGQGQAENGG
ncbi:MAG: hypothetical protein RI897_4232 [Verrucomicrobiota bacterium]